MKWLRCGVNIAAFSLMVVSASAGAPFTLVKDGKPTCSIIIAAKASENARIAAQELQNYVEKISGAKLDIYTDGDNIPNGPRVLVGRSRLTDAMPDLEIPTALTEAFREEGYVIHSTGDTLVLAGNDTGVPEGKKLPTAHAPLSMDDSLYLGTRYAVYDLLNRLGVRWFAPGEYGEVVPKSTTLRIPELSVTERPDFPVRSFWMCGDDEEMHKQRITWMIRNRMNPRSVFWFGIPGDSSLRTYMPKDQVEAHPEWFALQPNGTRFEYMPCMADDLRRGDPKHAGQPRLLDAIMKKIGEEAEKGQLGSAFSPDDGMPTCECDLCRRTSIRFTDGYCAEPPGGRNPQLPAAPGDPVPEYLTSQEWFFFVDGVLDAAGKNYPGHLIAANGYANRYAPPEVGPDFNRYKNLVIMYADILGCTIHRYNDPKCWQMRQQYNFLKQWVQLCDKVWLYGYNYTMLVTKDTITPMAKRLRANIPMVKDAGAIGFHDQEWADMSQLGLPTYVTRFALEWNTKANVDAILADFYRKWFGPAAKPMRDYYETLENAFDSARCHGHEDVILSVVYTPKVIAQSADYMARAEAAAATDTEKLHVRMERLGFDHLCLYVDSLQAKNELRFADAARLMRQMLALKGEMRKITKFFGLASPTYGGQWETERMNRLAAKVNGKESDLLVPMPETARFRTDKHDVGRSDRWMEPDYNDARWQVCGITNGWQSQGLKDEDGLPLLTVDGHPYKGLAWYRFTVDVPAVAQDMQAGLFLPAIINQGWAWVNGQYVGRNDYMQGWFRPQEMDVDVTRYVKPGKNVITLRVLCLEEYFGANGIYERPFLYVRKR